MNVGAAKRALLNAGFRFGEALMGDSPGELHRAHNRLCGAAEEYARAVVEAQRELATRGSRPSRT